MDENLIKILSDFTNYYMGINKEQGKEIAEKFLKTKYNNLKPIVEFSNIGGINPRTINCCCSNKKCEIGISFDENLLRFNDKYNIEHNMKINKGTAEKLIEELKEFL